MKKKKKSEEQLLHDAFLAIRWTGFSNRALFIDRAGNPDGETDARIILFAVLF